MVGSLIRESRPPYRWGHYAGAPLAAGGIMLAPALRAPTKLKCTFAFVPVSSLELTQWSAKRSPEGG